MCLTILLVQALAVEVVVVVEVAHEDVVGRVVVEVPEAGAGADLVTKSPAYLIIELLGLFKGFKNTSFCLNICTVFITVKWKKIISIFIANFCCKLMHLLTFALDVSCLPKYPNNIVQF